MRVGAVIAAAGKSGGYKSYDKMKSVDGIQVLRQMILNFKRAGVDEIVLITGYQAEQVEKKLAKLGAVFLRSEDYEKEEMITSAVRGMNYLKPRCEKFFFCPAGVSLFTEDTVRVLMQKAKENENDHEKVYVPVWEERKGHPILMDRSMIDQFASYEGEGGLKGAMDVLNVERIFVPVEDNGVAIYSGQGEPFREIFKEKEKERRIRPRVKLQLEKNENFFGPGIVFLLRQIDEAAIVIGVARTAVDGDVIARKHVGLLLAGGTRAAKQRTDARFEFQNVEGLGQIVVRPVLKAHELVHILRFCG